MIRGKINMYSPSTKTNLQILFVLFIVAVLLVCLSFMTATDLQPVIAQEPPINATSVLETFSREDLAAFGLSLEEIQAASGNFDVRVSVRASTSSVSSGGLVTFTTTITNGGPDLAQYLLFSQNLPAGITPANPTPVFGPGVTAISNGANPPTWLLTNPIITTSPVTISVSGRINSVCSTIATYSASVFPFETTADSILSNNQQSAPVNVITGITCLYLPIIRKDPTPTPNPIAFYDDFSTQQWTTADDDDCERSYASGEYQIKAKKEGDENDNNCFSNAPTGTSLGNPSQTYGTFRVKARRESGTNNFTVAIYANGAGGETYYALEVNPGDDCSWRLIRREEDENDGDADVKRSGSCDAAIRRNSEWNTLELRHASNGDISVFVNGTQLGSTYNDGSQLGGTGTGVYARTNNNDSVTVRFDDFTVIR
jgi:uncharacterized repeat protein (TIGR01451 family)